MQFATSFIEYLVTGSLALLWLLPLCRGLRPEIADTLRTEVSFFTTWTAIAVAWVYVIGLLLDFVAYKLMRSRRKVIRRAQEDLNRRYKDALKARRVEAIDDHALIWFKAPELAKILEAYSTRDRIARGATINFAIAAVADPLAFWSYPSSPIIGVVFLVLATTAYFAWFRFQSLSRKLKKEAVITILHHSDSQNGGL
jgi:hypothetical protein